MPTSSRLYISIRLSRTQRAEVNIVPYGLTADKKTAALQGVLKDTLQRNKSLTGFSIYLIGSIC